MPGGSVFGNLRQAESQTQGWQCPATALSRKQTNREQAVTAWSKCTAQHQSLCILRQRS
jgi:hypothetical protein